MKLIHKRFKLRIFFIIFKLAMISIISLLCFMSTLIIVIMFNNINLTKYLSLFINENKVIFKDYSIGFDKIVSIKNSNFNNLKINLELTNLVVNNTKQSINTIALKKVSLYFKIENLLTGNIIPEIDLIKDTIINMPIYEKSNIKFEYDTASNRNNLGDNIRNIASNFNANITKIYPLLYHKLQLENIKLNLFKNDKTIHEFTINKSKTQILNTSNLEQDNKKKLSKLLKILHTKIQANDKDQGIIRNVQKYLNTIVQSTFDDVLINNSTILYHGKKFNIDSICIFEDDDLRTCLMTIDNVPLEIIEVNSYLQKHVKINGLSTVDLFVNFDNEYNIKNLYSKIDIMNRSTIGYVNIPVAFDVKSASFEILAKDNLSVISSLNCNAKTNDNININLTGKNIKMINGGNINDGHIQVKINDFNLNAMPHIANILIDHGFGVEKKIINFLSKIDGGQISLDLQSKYENSLKKSYSNQITVQNGIFKLDNTILLNNINLSVNNTADDTNLAISNISFEDQSIVSNTNITFDHQRKISIFNTDGINIPEKIVEFIKHTYADVTDHYSVLSDHQYRINLNGSAVVDLNQVHRYNTCDLNVGIDIKENDVFNKFLNINLKKTSEKDPFSFMINFLNTAINSGFLNINKDTSDSLSLDGSFNVNKDYSVDGKFDIKFDNDIIGDATLKVVSDKHHVPFFKWRIISNNNLLDSNFSKDYYLTIDSDQFNVNDLDFLLHKMKRKSDNESYSLDVALNIRNFLTNDPNETISNIIANGTLYSNPLLYNGHAFCNTSVNDQVYSNIWKNDGKALKILFENIAPMINLMPSLEYKYKLFSVVGNNIIKNKTSRLLADIQMTPRVSSLLSIIPESFHSEVYATNTMIYLKNGVLSCNLLDLTTNGYYNISNGTVKINGVLQPKKIIKTISNFLSIIKHIKEKNYEFRKDIDQKEKLLVDDTNVLSLGQMPVIEKLKIIFS